MRTRTTHDAVVIGAGFGGLGAALRLSELGARVAVCETLGYPGGCASTFERQGRTYEAGATLFSGLGEGQLFRRWIDRYDLDVEIEWPDPVVEFRTPDWTLPVPRHRDGLLRAFEAFPDAPVQGLRRFFARQQKVADVLWELLDDPGLLPPFDWTRHLPRLPRYLPLLRLAGKPLRRVLERDGVAEFAPLVQYLDGLCQITVQCGIDEAEAPLALGAMDYYYRGTGHVRGGIGQLAGGLVDAIRRNGGDVLLANGVSAVEREGSAWSVRARRGELRAPHIFANLLPHSVQRLAGIESRRLRRLARDVETGWGACMLYLDAAPSGPPRHVQIVQDPSQPLLEGNHLFCSLGEVRAGMQAVTVSTHVRPSASPEEIERIQERMREGVARVLPEVRVVDEMTASPRTFERFTGRPGGHVGGVPRRAGLHNYRHMAPKPVASGFHLVGDSLFPGQSTLAAALGGCRTAEVALGSRLSPSRNRTDPAPGRVVSTSDSVRDRVSRQNLREPDVVAECRPLAAEPAVPYDQ